jgi:hypothetical protein
MSGSIGNLNATGDTLNVTSTSTHGTLVVTTNGGASFTGTTNIINSTVELHASLSGNVNIASNATFDTHFLTASYTVSSGYTVAGSGTVEEGGAGGFALTAASGATIAAGSSPNGPSPAGVNPVGTLNINGPLSLQDGSTLSINIFGNQNSNVSESMLSLANDGGSGVHLQLNLNPADFSAIAAGEVFFIASNNNGGTFSNPTTGPETISGFSGMYTVLNVPNNGGFQFAISYNASITGDLFSTAGGTDIALMAVPEPSTVATMLAGLASLAGLQRFRRRSARK